MTLRDRFEGLFSGAAGERLFGVPTPSSLLFSPGQRRPDDESWPITSPLALHVLNELCASSLAADESDRFRIEWDDVYRVLVDADREASLRVLNIPSIGTLRPRLRSANSLDDPDFEVRIDGWLDETGRVDATRIGAVARTAGGLQLLPQPSFELANAISDFWSDSERSAESNRRHWGRIRTLAVRAAAGLDQFLAGTIVLTPEKLQIRLTEANVADLGVVEVQPWFAGAPESWLGEFDRAPKVRDRYQIVTDEGVIEVLISPQVKTVLRAIKSMPGRRTAGAAAERFLHNPFAALGPDAVAVLDEEQFDEARREAGIEFERFSCRVAVDGKEVAQVGLLIERLAEQSGEAVYERFRDPADLRAFIAKVQSKLETGSQLCEWRKHRLELTGETESELAVLKSAHLEWSKPRITIKALDVLDLARYSERVSGIGVQPKIVSPYIPAQSGEDPWFPELPFGSTSTISVSVPIDDKRDLELAVDKKVYDTLSLAASEAEHAGRDTISIPGHESAIPLATAKAIVDQLSSHFNDRKPSVDKGPASGPLPGPSKHRRELLLRTNIDQSEFAEERASELQLSPNARPRLPVCLKQSVTLLDHQATGVAWLQNLFDKSPEQVRGAVLADDMGLGKTLQLLTVICRALEEHPTIEPVLVVAPVSLLENWKEETEKFFSEGRPRILTLYGTALESLRAPRQTIDAELIEQGITRFLTPGWIGDAQLVLTTYETLRDLEFSLAAVHWSIMICDEAQKIKNPAAMVTRSAKKQNVRFRVACTGTPVENSLADLWCLFDFVQPGLLGALNDFGTTYRRPIECETEEQKSRLKQLRDLIEPQILRRTKQEVAKDLPPKIVVDEPRKLRISHYQRALYGDALEKFKLRHDPNAQSPFRNHLGLLQYLRRLCIAPETGSRIAKEEPLSSYRKKNPKIDWLIATLHKIKTAGEKAIVFCEFRDVQTLLAYYIEGEFGFRPDIINGDTETSSASANSRQKRIKRFQIQPGFGVIILSPLAVGFGVNIQASNHVIHFSRTWNPAKEDQATDRAYRIGQTKPVFVYYPVIGSEDFTTFDVKLDQLLERKRSVADDMLNGCGDLSPDDFSDIAKVDDPVFSDQIDIHDVTTLSPIEFEALIAVLWKKQGFKTVTLTARTGDAGVDVVAKTVAIGELIQCKSSATENIRLGWDAIKDVVTGEAKYRFENPGVAFSKVAVTNQWFNDNAHSHARLNSVRLVDKAALGELLNKHPVVRGDLDAFLTIRKHVRVILETAE